jgi:hypothetical protein
VTNRPNVVTIGDFIADDDVAIVTKVTGWGSAPKRVSINARAQQIGGWDATGFDGPRQIEVEGVVLADTPQDAAARADALAALSPRTIQRFSVDNETLGLRWCMARVTVGPEPEWIDDSSFAYSLTLIAPDPLKYGAENFGQAPFAAAVSGTGLVYPLAYPLDYGVAPGITPGSVACANAGTASYWPTLRIDGPVRNPVVSLVETGDWIRYGGTIADGQHLDIDCANRRVTIGDTPVSVRSKVTSYGSWLAVPPGGGSVAVTADTAGANSALSVWSREGAWS